MRKAILLLALMAVAIFLAGAVVSVPALGMIGGTSVAEAKPSDADDRRQEKENKPQEKAKAANAQTVRTCHGASIKLKPEEKRILDLHNEVRKRHGLGSLCVDPELTRAARAHSKEMLDERYFGHSSRNGESSGARLKRFGHEEWRASGENLAWGSGSLSAPEDRFEAWMQSPGHRKNILHKDFREVGVGVATGDSKKKKTGKHTMYTVDFGTRR